ncbi:MAG: CHASE2 domain-containing protein [Thermodesulfobacteriota bacterium]
MQPSQKTVPYLIITASIILIAIILILKPPVFIEFLEAKTFDMRFLVRGSVNMGNEVAIVGIDNKSLEKVGRWPWSREETARLIEKVAEGGARTIGFDILFSEPQITEGLQTARDIKSAFESSPASDEAFLTFLNKQERKKNVDEILASTVREAGNVILPFALEVPTIYEGAVEYELPDILYNYPFMMVKKGDLHLPIVAERALLPLEPFIRASSSIGHVYTLYDRDGAIRWEPLSVTLGDSIFPSFGVEVARHYLGVKREEVRLITGEGILLGERFIPTDTSGRALINYRGRAGAFTTYSAVDVLEERIPLDSLKGKIVLIGTTALGTADIHITPFAQLSGVEKQAAVIANIIHNTFLKREEGAKLTVVAITALFGIVMGIAIPKLRVLLGAALSFTLLIGYLAVTQYLFSRHGLWIDLLTPSSSIVILYSSLTAYRFLAEERKSKEIKTMFSSYVTEKVVDELLRNPEMAKLGGHRREVTVLFSDIRGFTSFSEKRQPEEVVSILNEYLREMTDIIFRWEGTLDKFVGDEIMAFWGAPLHQENHAELALRCSLHMMKRLSELQEKWKREGKYPLDIGIGLNTGDVLVGNIGAEGKKMDYTIMGDNVNLGARVEALTRPYNTHILLTEFTVKHIKELIMPDDPQKNRFGHVNLKTIESVQVKGKEQAVMIFELTGLKETGSPPGDKGEQG